MQSLNNKRESILIGLLLVIIVSVTCAKSYLWITAPLEELNSVERVKQLTLPAEQGNVDAQLELGFLYLNGLGIPRNYTEAFKWYTKASDQGDKRGMFYLGEIYYFGHGVLENYPEAIKWYTKAAELGDKSAQKRLGGMYSSAQGGPENSVEAIRWYTISAVQGDAESQWKLGDIYFKAENYPEAMKWYTKAAEQGSYVYQNELGMKYSIGKGTPKNEMEAYKWLALSTKTKWDGFMSEEQNAVVLRDKLAAGLTKEQLLEAQRLAKQIEEQIKDKKETARKARNNTRTAESPGWSWKTWVLFFTVWLLIARMRQLKSRKQ